MSMQVESFGPDAPRASVLLCHGGGGITEHERGRAHALAELGFAVHIPDLFGEPFRDRAHGMSVIRELVDDPPTLRGRLLDALEHLRERAGSVPLHVLGYCFGGLAALELARAGADVATAISLHGGLHTRAPARPGDIRARILACTGAADPFVTKQHRDDFEREMTDAGAHWQLTVYGGAQHGFTEQRPPAPGIAYDEHADRDSWRAVLALVS